jgi:PAS domain S-box-containing protein
VQARLAENANQLRLFVEHSPAAIAMFDRDMRYLVVSHRWVEDYGLGDRQILGRSHYEIFPEIPERWKEIHRRCLAGAVERCEEDPFPRPDGSTDWVHWEVRPWHQASGEIGGIIIFSEVITARKRAEEAVRESEERLRLALDAAHMGTFDWDIPNNRITWSRWHRKLWGFGPGEFGGTYESFSERVHPEDLPGISAEVERCMAARAPFACEFRVIWPDGSVRWVSGRGEFTFDAGGRPLRMRGVVLEITERKQAEEKLREYAHQLEILSRRLLDAQEEERRRIARELHDQAGQALTALKITLQMPATATRRAESLALADEVLAQVRALSFDLRPSLLDDLGLAAALRAHAERLCKRTKLALRLELADFETRPAGEIETACFRIAQEALTNVVRHAGAATVTIALQREGDAILLAVRDDGRGFDPARATDASIGLLGMRERAELAGGRLEIESAPGRGTAVCAWLPWRAREGLT